MLVQYNKKRKQLNSKKIYIYKILSCGNRILLRLKSHKAHIVSGIRDNLSQ